MDLDEKTPNQGLNEMISYLKREKIKVEKCKLLAKFYLEFENLTNPIGNYRSLLKNPLKTRELRRAGILSNYINDPNNDYSPFPEYEKKVDMIQHKNDRKITYFYLLINILAFLIVYPISKNFLENYIVDTDYGQMSFWLV